MFSSTRANQSPISTEERIVVVNIISNARATDIRDELRITYEQKHLMDKLRRRILPHIVEGFMKEDLYLIRWLRATKFNVDDAYTKIIENIKWRKDNKIATLLLEDFSDMEADYPYMFTEDKQGQPVFIGFAGEWDLRNAILTGRSERLHRYINYQMEAAIKRLRGLQMQGKNVTRVDLIIDLESFNLVQHGCMQCLFRVVDFLHLYDFNYPGVADKVILINAPPSIAVGYEMVRNNVNSETMKALKLYGRDKSVWQKVLFEIIDSNKLPPELGGSLKLEQSVKVR